MPIIRNITDTFEPTGSNELEIKACQTLNRVFEDALSQGISDVHFEDEDSHGNIRVRLHGVLYALKETLDSYLLSAMRQKIFSRCNISDSEADLAPVDGRFFLKFPSGRVDLRVNCSPTVKGGTLVCRLLDQSNASADLSKIEMTDAVRSAIQGIIKSPSGLVLVTGPTGSGKTTTLYSIIQELNDSSRKIITVEQPVEYIVPNLQQINIDRNISFAQALRASMRQDPDIILIGEIRDAETAKIAIEAALTGHLVISTLHSNSALASIPRLIEMGVDRSMLAQVLKAVAAQRLCRRLSTTKCVDDVAEEHLGWLSTNGFKHLQKKQFGVSFKPEMYKGRVPVIELAMITNDMRKAISTNNIFALEEMAKNQIQYETLPEGGVRLAMEGKTSLEEVISMAESATKESLVGLRIGEKLIRLGYLTEYQLNHILDVQKAQHTNQRQYLGELLVEHNMCSQEQVDEALQHQ